LKYDGIINAILIENFLESVKIGVAAGGTGNDPRSTGHLPPHDAFFGS